jgi:hypothetical protein
MDVRTLTDAGLRQAMGQTVEAVNPLQVRLRDAEMREDLARQEAVSLRLALSHVRVLIDIYRTEKARREAQDAGSQG